MRRELQEIPRDEVALAFALECLRAAMVLAVHSALQSAWPAARLKPGSGARWSRSRRMLNLSRRLRLIGLVMIAGTAALAAMYLLVAAS